MGWASLFPAFWTRLAALQAALLRHVGQAGDACRNRRCFDLASTAGLS
jgi:predicted nicotinamide N-methyase